MQNVWQNRQGQKMPFFAQIPEVQRNCCLSGLGRSRILEIQFSAQLPQTIQSHANSTRTQTSTQNPKKNRSFIWSLTFARFWIHRLSIFWKKNREKKKRRKKFHCFLVRMKNLIDPLWVVFDGCWKRSGAGRPRWILWKRPSTQLWGTSAGPPEVAPFLHPPKISRKSPQNRNAETNDQPFVRDRRLNGAEPRGFLQSKRRLILGKGKKSGGQYTKYQLLKNKVYARKNENWS